MKNFTSDEALNRAIVETETGWALRVKLEGDAPTSGGGLQLETATVQTDVGTKQALLSAVPAGKKRVVVRATVRAATADLATYEDGITFGFDAGAGDYLGEAISFLTNDARLIPYDFDNPPYYPVGNAGDVFGILFANTSIDATVKVDVVYYDVDAE